MLRHHLREPVPPQYEAGVLRPRECRQRVRRGCTVWSESLYHASVLRFQPRQTRDLSQVGNCDFLEKVRFRCHKATARNDQDWTTSSTRCCHFDCSTFVTATFVALRGALVEGVLLDRFQRI